MAVTKITRLHKFFRTLKLTGEQKELLRAGKLLDDYVEAANEFYARLRVSAPAILNSSNVIFEGAQGLLLDEDYGWFPNVTRSSTGLKNVVEIVAEAGLNSLNCVYVTRAYATRHGAGHLPHELSGKPYAQIEDTTNIPNPHQDHLRFGWLDLDLLSSKINADFERYGSVEEVKFTRQLAITCLDQLEASAFFMSGNNLCETTINNFVTAAAQAIGTGEVYASYGQTHETVTKMDI